MKTPDAATDDSFSIKRQLIAAGVMIVGLVAGVGGWAASAKMMGAVIASGSFAVERNVRKVQHNIGGIVAEIRVKNGDRVQANDIILQLDQTQARAEVGVLRGQKIELIARLARLKAERDGATDLTFPPQFEASGPEAADAIAGERRLFVENSKTRDGQKEQLRFKIKQIDDDLAGLQSQLEAKAAELSIANNELNNVRTMFARQLVTGTRLNAVERDVRRLGGEHGSVVSQMARARSHIAEVKTQIATIDEGAQATAQRDFRIAEAKLAEIGEREAAARDKLERIVIRAPVTGTVHELAVHTIGGVVSAAEQMMLIVPDDENLIVQARIQPNDIDQIALDRPVRLRLSALNQQDTPEVEGIVSHIASDISLDPKSGQGFYQVRIELAEKARKALGNVRLVPGMPVEAFISTGERTALSYLSKPFTDQMRRAFRER